MDSHLVERPGPLQVTLRRITERLAHELSQPSCNAPDWSERDWTLARAVAAMHGVSPLLARTLRWQGPANWREFLAQQRGHTIGRHVRIAALLQRIDQRAHEEGIAGLALKGAALHAMGLYSPGDRPMADIDLLVRPHDAARTAAMLTSLGFRASYACWKETVFTPFEDHAPAELGEHVQNDIKIELHERVCEKLPLRITDASDQLFPVDPSPGLNPYPSRASLMIHLLLHAAGAMAFQALRLLHLHDIALLSARLTDADWDQVLRSSVAHERLWWAYPPLRLTSVYYPAAVPARVLQFLERKCPWLLGRVSRRKTLSDVSYSHVWVDAFPGIEWCRSAPEMMRYAATRIKPSAEHLALREMTAKSQAWASGSSWSSLSQGRRILRWLTSRQTRPATLHGIHAAMAQAR